MTLSKLMDGIGGPGVVEVVDNSLGSGSLILGFPFSIVGCSISILVVISELRYYCFKCIRPCLRFTCSMCYAHWKFALSF